MNHSNSMIIISTFMLAVVFFGAVFININIKNSKNDLDKLYEEINQLDIELKRQDLEIAFLTSPGKVLDFIEEHGYKSVPLKDIEILKIIE
jgi:hypothetical protein